MGDVIALCDAAPIEIGNRVWNDANNNGVQDAGETGINGVSVALYRDGVKVGETTTASDGSYYFNNSNVTLNGAAGIVPGTGSAGSNSAYEIRIASNQAALAGFAATLSNASADQRDSDGTLSGARYRCNRHARRVWCGNWPVFAQPEYRPTPHRTHLRGARYPGSGADHAAGACCHIPHPAHGRPGWNRNGEGWLPLSNCQ